MTAKLIDVYDHIYYNISTNMDSTEIKVRNENKHLQKVYKKTDRVLGLRYRTINNYSDSVFIPFGISYNPYISVKIQGKDSIRSYIFRRQCGNNRIGRDSFAPNDTINLLFTASLTSSLLEDNQWLEKVDIYDLLSRMQINLAFDSKSLQRKDVHIPNITFINDTDSILINPKLTIKGK